MQRITDISYAKEVVNDEEMFVVSITWITGVTERVVVKTIEGVFNVYDIHNKADKFLEEQQNAT